MAFSNTKGINLEEWNKRAEFFLIDWLQYEPLGRSAVENLKLFASMFIGDPLSDEEANEIIAKSPEIAAALDGGNWGYASGGGRNKGGYTPPPARSPRGPIQPTLRPRSRGSPRIAMPTRERRSESPGFSKSYVRYSPAPRTPSPVRPLSSWSSSSGSPGFPPHRTPYSPPWRTPSPVRPLRLLSPFNSPRQTMDDRLDPWFPSDVPGSSSPSENAQSPLHSSEADDHDYSYTPKSPPPRSPHSQTSFPRSPSYGSSSPPSMSRWSSYQFQPPKGDNHDYEYTPKSPPPRSLHSHTSLSRSPSYGSPSPPSMSRWSSFQFQPPKGDNHDYEYTPKSPPPMPYRSSSSASDDSGDESLGSEPEGRTPRSPLPTGRQLWLSLERGATQMLREEAEEDAKNQQLADEQEKERLAADDEISDADIGSPLHPSWDKYGAQRRGSAASSSSSEDSQVSFGSFSSSVLSRDENSPPRQNAQQEAAAEEDRFLYYLDLDGSSDSGDSSPARPKADRNIIPRPPNWDPLAPSSDRFGWKKEQERYFHCGINGQLFFFDKSNPLVFELAKDLYQRSGSNEIFIETHWTKIETTELDEECKSYVFSQKADEARKKHLICQRPAEFYEYYGNGKIYTFEMDLEEEGNEALLHGRGITFLKEHWEEILWTRPNYLELQDVVDTLMAEHYRMIEEHVDDDQDDDDAEDDSDDSLSSIDEDQFPDFYDPHQQVAPVAQMVGDENADEDSDIYDDDFEMADSENDSDEELERRQIRDMEEARHRRRFFNAAHGARRF